MKKQKILIISPTPTHPANAGNRSRILVYASHLLASGHEVHFLYSDQEEGDPEAMREFWKERFHHVPYRAPEQKEYPAWLKKLIPDYRYYCHVDDHYNLLLDDRITNLQREHRFTAVFAEYIFLSRALLNFGGDVLKIIDTHDVMTNRHRHFLKAGKEPVWYSTTVKEEKKGIERADIVMAIQEREAAFYRKLTRKRVASVGHIVPVNETPVTAGCRRRLLFVGSNNPNNYHAVSDFLRSCFPLLRASFPGLEFVVAGKICDVLGFEPGLVKLGGIPDLDKGYMLSDIVVNPLTIGTGLKIKMIEAMGLGKTVISTGVGAEGLESARGRAYLVADRPEEFLRHLRNLFSDASLHAKISREALAFVRDYNRKQEEMLDSFFPQRPG